jgi:F0F1-type ATP synthase assembly protein I
MKKKQSQMFSLFIPGVLLGAVIGFIFGSLLVAQMADDITTSKIIANDAAPITTGVQVTP